MPQIELHHDAQPWVLAHGDRDVLQVWAASEMPAGDPAYVPVAEFVHEHGMKLAAWRARPAGEIPGITGPAIYAVYLSAEKTQQAVAGEALADEVEVGFALLDYLQPE